MISSRPLTAGSPSKAASTSVARRVRRRVTLPESELQWLGLSLRSQFPFRSPIRAFDAIIMTQRAERSGCQLIVQFVDQISNVVHHITSVQSFTATIAWIDDVF